MPRKHILTLLTAITMAGCTSPEQPVSAIETVDVIPADELSTAETPALDEDTPCVSVPPEVVTPAGFTTPPVLDSPPGCIWVSDENLVLTVSSVMPMTMAQQVAQHARMDLRTGNDSPAHLEWLRIDGNYAIERILGSDNASTCFLILDVRAPKPVEIQVYRLDPATNEAVDTTPTQATKEFCPTNRQVALNLLRHLDPH